ncbi:MAG: hypothetical protein RML94_00220 [Bacteroidia bacterium]|nr:hypothetical protein [Bacteroidia bacterium]
MPCRELESDLWLAEHELTEDEIAALKEEYLWWAEKMRLQEAQEEGQKESSPES